MDKFTEWLLRNGPYAVTADDVRRRFGDEPLTADDVLQALATAATCPAMEVDTTTPDDEWMRFCLPNALPKSAINPCMNPLTILILTGVPLLTAIAALLHSIDTRELIAPKK